MVKSIDSAADFDISVKNPLVMVKFSAKWCGPCKAVAPLIEKLEPNFPSVKFGDVDVDNLPDIARRFSVTSMPTFLFLHNGNEISRVVGGDISSVTQRLKELSKKTPSYGSGQRVGGSSTTVSSVAKIRELRQRALAGDSKNEMEAAESTKEKEKEDKKPTKPVKPRMTSISRSRFGNVGALLRNSAFYGKLYLWTLFTFDAKSEAMKLLR